MALGRCHCGAVRFEASAAPTFVCICHCRSCRKAAGAPMVAWATFQREVVHFTAGQLQEHESSPGVRRGHCVRCGTSLTYWNRNRPGEIDVTLASLDDPTSRPTAHIWVEDKLPWLVIADGLPQHRRTVTAPP